MVKTTNELENALLNTNDKSQQRFVKEVNKVSKAKKERIRQQRREASRMASMANKRLKRLEKNGLQDTPAYQKWIESGGEKFGVRGKTYNELQKEMARMRQFINSQTSTIKGVNNVLKEMADNTGIKYKNLKELRQSSSQFFELASKIEQYLRTVEDMASSIGYQKIWQQINQYVQVNKIQLGNSKNNIEELTRRVVEAMDLYNEKNHVKVEDSGYTTEGWFMLDKE